VARPQFFSLLYSARSSLGGGGGEARSLLYHEYLGCYPERVKQWSCFSLEKKWHTRGIFTAFPVFICPALQISGIPNQLIQTPYFRPFTNFNTSATLLPLLIHSLSPQNFTHSSVLYQKHFINRVAWCLDSAYFTYHCVRQSTLTTIGQTGRPTMSC
jgi:hypothetical protein